MNRVTPSTHLVGYTCINLTGLYDYLLCTRQDEFLDDVKEAESRGLSDGEILCSFYAKLCYKSLVEGRNANVSKIRSIDKNFEGIINSGHGAVLEHASLNFVTTDCSRVFTHELVRHRVGTAYSQTSGRFVALGVDNEGNDVDLDMVIDPLLDPVREDIDRLVSTIESTVRDIRKKLKVEDMSFEQKKKFTSAIRRLAPNGQANEIGWSVNIRSLRHLIQLRTSRHSEWEIRLIFNQVARIVLDRWPNILYGHKCESVDGIVEYTNLHV